MFLYGDSYTILNEMEKDSIDMILTDPPFTISKESHFHKGDNTKFNNMTHDFGEWDKTRQDLFLMMKLFRKVLRPGGTLILFYDIWKTELLREACEQSGFKQPRVGIWLKTNPTPVNQDSNYLSNSHEFYFSFIHRPKRGNRGREHTFNSSYDNGVLTYPSCNRWESIGHPNQKPVELFKELIKKHSNEGDMILDPFSGSGTTSIAADSLGRNFICIENDTDYFNKSTIRYKTYKNELTHDNKEQKSQQ